MISPKTLPTLSLTNLPVLLGSTSAPPSNVVTVPSPRQMEGTNDMSGTLLGSEAVGSVSVTPISVTPPILPAQLQRIKTGTTSTSSNTNNASSTATASAPAPPNAVKTNQFQITHPKGNLTLPEKVLESYAFNILMSVLTVYALVGDDFRLASFDLEDDQIFYTTSLTALLLFILELVLNHIYRPSYRYGFYFWLDLISTLSMLPDTNLLNTDGGLNSEGGGGDGQGTQTLKAGKTSRAGARAGRIVRIIRLIRFVRIFKLVKMRKERNDKKNMIIQPLQTEDEKLTSEPSKVGKKLTELTVRKVIIIVLVMIMVFPFLDDPDSFLGTDVELNSFQRYKIVDLHYMTDRFNVTGTVSEKYFKDEVQRFASDGFNTLGIVYVKFNHWDIDVTNGWIDEVQDLRASTLSTGYNSRHLLFTDTEEIVKHFRIQDAKSPSSGTLETCVDVDPTNDDTNDDKGDNNDCGTTIYYNLTEYNQFVAILSLFRTLTIVFGLTLSVLVFSRDAENLVINPIERMIKLVKKLSENPLASLYSEKSETDVIEGADAFETTLLENTLSKISSLLQVGFGVAGAEIIQSNMSSGGDLNVMIPGKKITAVFGFGIMDEFTNTCSCLEESMCTYINTIAKIIHENTILYHGAPNKNIGAAFLLVWKICDGVLPGLRDLRDESGVELDSAVKLKMRENIGYMRKGTGTVERKVLCTEMVDSATISLIKNRIDLYNANGSRGVLNTFKQNSKIVSYFDGMFNVQMGFGMHIGWAIEGAIGSTYKIDASYLSPNVNMAARLEAATHQFGTPILLSGSLVNEMSVNCQNLCRKIDIVTVKGSQIPLQLWTADITNNEAHWLVPRMFEGMQQPIDFKRVSSVQRDFSSEFKDIFTSAVDDYVSGNWAKAKEGLEMGFKIYDDDGPSRSLWGVLDKHNFVAPVGWEGFRELTSK